jgi:hypothetical protein
MCCIVVMRHDLHMQVILWYLSSYVITGDDIVLGLQYLKNCHPYQVVVPGIDERLAIAYPTMTMLHLHTLTLIRYPYLCLFIFSNPRCLTSVTTELKCLMPVWGLGAPSDDCRKYLASAYYAFSHKVGLVWHQLYFHFISLILPTNVQF